MHQINTNPPLFGFFAENLVLAALVVQVRGCKLMVIDCFCWLWAIVGNGGSSVGSTGVPVEIRPAPTNVCGARHRFPPPSKTHLLGPLFFSNKCRHASIHTCVVSMVDGATLLPIAGWAPVALGPHLGPCRVGNASAHCRLGPRCPVPQAGLPQDGQRLRLSPVGPPSPGTPLGPPTGGQRLCPLPVGPPNGPPFLWASNWSLTGHATPPAGWPPAGPPSPLALGWTPIT